jgi:hypothetical protein
MSDRPAPDIRLDVIEPQSVLDGLDHFTGVFALVVTVMIGVDLYSWLWRNQPPKLAILWFAPIAVKMWTRARSGEDTTRRTTAWDVAWVAYSGVILAIVLIKGMHTTDDWWMAGFAALGVGIGAWKASRP